MLGLVQLGRDPERNGPGFLLLLNIHPDVWFRNGGFEDKYSCSIVGFVRSLVWPCLDGEGAPQRGRYPT